MNTQTKFLYSIAVVLFMALAVFAASPVIRLDLEMNNSRKAFHVDAYQGSDTIIRTYVTESGNAYADTNFFLSLDFGTNGVLSTTSTRVSSRILAAGYADLTITPAQLPTNITYYAVISITNSSSRFVVGHGYLNVKGLIP